MFPECSLRFQDLRKFREHVWKPKGHGAALYFLVTIIGIHHHTFLAEIKFYKDRHDCYCAGNEGVCATATKTTFASFNIQVFGASKYSKTLVKDQIVTILRRYDISTIQEIRESSGESFPKLVADMNAQEDIYDFHVGERQGRSSSKEQVGFIWNRNMFSMVAG